MPLQLPSVRHLFRQALPQIAEGTLAPVGLFYLGYAVFGLLGGLAGALAWSYAGVVRRLVRGQPVPGLVLLSALAVTGRAGLAVTTGSAFVYFLQPTLGTFVTGVAFLGSVFCGEPLTQRLSKDLVKLPEAVASHPEVGRLHVKLSVLWAAAFVLNGTVALWLLMSQSVGIFLVLKSVASGVVVAGAVAVSTVAFHRCVRRHGLRVAAA